MVPREATIPIMVPREATIPTMGGVYTPGRLIYPPWEAYTPGRLIYPPWEAIHPPWEAIHPPWEAIHTLRYNLGILLLTLGYTGVNLSETLRRTGYLCAEVSPPPVSLLV